MHHPVFPPPHHTLLVAVHDGVTEPDADEDDDPELDGDPVELLVRVVAGVPVGVLAPDFDAVGVLLGVAVKLTGVLVLVDVKVRDAVLVLVIAAVLDRVGLYVMLALAEELPDPLELEDALADALWLDVSDPVAAPLGVLLPVRVRLPVILADLVLLPVADAVDVRDSVGVLVAAAVGVRVPL